MGSRPGADVLPLRRATSCRPRSSSAVWQFPPPDSTSGGKNKIPFLMSGTKRQAIKNKIKTKLSTCARFRGFLHSRKNRPSFRQTLRRFRGRTDQFSARESKFRTHANGAKKWGWGDTPKIAAKTAIQNLSLNYISSFGFAAVADANRTAQPQRKSGTVTESTRDVILSDGALPPFQNELVFEG